MITRVEEEDAGLFTCRATALATGEMEERDIELQVTSRLERVIINNKGPSQIREPPVWVSRSEDKTVVQGELRLKGTLHDLIMSGAEPAALRRLLKSKKWIFV